MAVADIITRPGVWKRAGMTGVNTGLDLGEALASLPERCDREFSRELFITAERAFIPAQAALAEADKAADDKDEA